MDYLDILKRAWNITWKYKALWVLGFFAGASGTTSSGGSSNYSTGSGDYTGGGAQFDQAYRTAFDFAQDNVVLIAVLAGLAVVVIIVLWVVSIAAQGGLVHGANEAAADRPVSLRASWGVGFARWGRTFMIGLVLGLPLLFVIGLLVGILLTAGIGGALTGEEGAAIALGGVCFLLPILFVAIVAGSLIVGILYQLALRYGVIEDRTFGQAIAQGWADLWAKRGAWVFWLVMLLPGIAFGVAVFLLMLPFIVGMVALVIAELWAVIAVLILVLMVAMMVPTAIYGTFVSAAWTVFFRRMTGLEPGAAAARPAPAGYQPPVAPAPAYAPPAPPAASLSEQPEPRVAEPPAESPAEPPAPEAPEQPEQPEQPEPPADA